MERLLYTPAGQDAVDHAGQPSDRQGAFVLFHMDPVARQESGGGLGRRKGGGGGGVCLPIQMELPFTQASLMLSWHLSQG